MNQGSTSWADYSMGIRILFATVSCLCRATNDVSFEIRRIIRCFVWCALSLEWVTGGIRHCQLFQLSWNERTLKLYIAQFKKNIQCHFLDSWLIVNLIQCNKFNIQSCFFFWTHTSIVHCTLYINHINYMTWLYGLLFRRVTVANWGWADAAKIFLLRLVSDKGSANLKMIQQGILKDRPANCIVFSKTCDQ